MLKAMVQKIRDTTIVRCQGRITVGENFAALRNAVLRHSSTDLVVLDLACVRTVDAGGLGVLLGLRGWAEANSIRLKLMNVLPKVQRMLKLTKLDRIFEYFAGLKSSDEPTDKVSKQHDHGKILPDGSKVGG